ncbi:hypothetical protein EMCRGX_G006506 [Ephydatia muelleri]
MDLRAIGYAASGEETFKHANYEMGHTRRFQSENEYLRERVKSCERGLLSIYQLLLQQEDDVTARSQPRALGPYRSASQVQLYRPAPAPHAAHPEAGRGGRGDESGSKPMSVPSASEVKELVLQVLKDRSELLSHVEDLHRITEAAKRERVLAIEEKDQLLHSTHLLKMALERKESHLKQLQEEKEELLRHNRQGSLALEERSKVIEERNQLKAELCDLQSERDNLFDEKVQLKGCVQELTAQGRHLAAELERTRAKFLKMEALAYNLKEHSEVASGKGEVLNIRLERKGVSQPWGFSIEGGVNSELFSGDPSIFITGIAEGSPASKQLALGDKIVSVEGHSFTPIDRKQATEILKSCDQTSFVMEIARPSSKRKPQTLQVHIPGRKVFGFVYESRLFVSRVEQCGAAANLLWSGDEIVQVMGKAAVNMKPSHLKQVLKSSKGGITLTIHRPPRGALHCPLLSTECPEYYAKTAEMLPSPGTPGSGASDTSMGYSSSHSLPSVFSTPGPPVAKGNKDGNGSIVAGTTGGSHLAVSGSPALTLHRGGGSNTQFGQLSVGGVRPLPPATPSTPTPSLLPRNLSDVPGASRGDLSGTQGSSLQFSARGATPTLLRNPRDESSNYCSSEEQQQGNPQKQKPPGEQQTCL